MNNSQLTGVIYLDLRKAFDTVDPEVLLLKLTWMGVNGGAHEWFTSYRQGRTQKVSHLGVTSESLPISHGVPQGSILGPLLFILFINDLPQCILNCKIGLYADDTVLLFSAKTVKEIETNLQADLNRAQDWFRINRLHLNTKKTKWSLIGTHQKLSKTESITLHVGDEPLEQVSEYKYLGMWFDENLNWNHHIDKMCAKLSKRLGMLRRIKFNLPKETLLMLYNTMVLPLIDYGNVVYSNCSATSMKKLQVMQNKGARMILNCHYRTHIVDMLKELKWLNVKDRAEFHKMCLVYKSKNGLVPSYISDLMSQVTERHEHETRSRTQNNLCLVKPKNNQLKRSFQYSGALGWNNLSTEIRSAPSLTSFKAKYLKAHFSK